MRKYFHPAWCREGVFRMTDEKKPPCGGVCGGRCRLLQRYLVQAGLLADPAEHAGVLHTDAAECGVWFGTGLHQVNAAACIAAMPVRVVIGKAAQLILRLLPAQLCILEARFKALALGLKQRALGSQQSQVLLKDCSGRSPIDKRCDALQDLVNQRLSLVWWVVRWRLTAPRWR